LGSWFPNAQKKSRLWEMKTSGIFQKNKIKSRSLWFFPKLKITFSTQNWKPLIPYKKLFASF
jgi:hypothetical protein